MENVAIPNVFMGETKRRCLAVLTERRNAKRTVRPYCVSAARGPGQRRRRRTLGIGRLNEKPVATGFSWVLGTR